MRAVRIYSNGETEAFFLNSANFAKQLSKHSPLGAEHFWAKLLGLGRDINLSCDTSAKEGERKLSNLVSRAAATVKTSIGVC